ncbi:MAG: hypothetical protein QNJ72_30365 [Pleurocapsa sp. MO_226.B13]|nr:hypothetical protein [Pleurocapsa sp. MO_226.B13]
MKQSSGSISIIIGVSILSVTFLGLIGVVYSVFRDSLPEETDAPELAEDDSPFEQLKKEKNIIIVPVPEQVGSSPGIDSSSNGGIPIGKYSNPPSTINSHGSSNYRENRPIDSFDSSVERNRQRQEAFDNTIPDYSQPSSSNNFNRSSDNSLIESLDNDDFLDSPSNDRQERINTPPLTESPF